MTTLSIAQPPPHGSALRLGARRLAFALGLALVRWSRRPALRRTGEQQKLALEAQRATEQSRTAFPYGVTQ